jgi:putative phosphoribosyl transferase
MRSAFGFLSARWFRDRRDAGRRLAERFAGLAAERPLVLALPRGGVPVAFEVANALRAPLDLVLVRKIGAPMDPELALGAIVDGHRPTVVVNRDIADRLGVAGPEIQAMARLALDEIERRRRHYLGERPSLDVTGRTAIVIDDGIATGATMEAALRALGQRGAKRLVLAVPVAPKATLRRLADLVDETVCLQNPADFGAVGSFYNEFRQVGDDEVVTLLSEAARAAVDPDQGG